MTMGSKLWISIAALAVILLAVMTLNRSKLTAPHATAPAPAAPAPVAEQTPVTPPAGSKQATGNVDDAVNSILGESSDDKARFDSTTQDSASINADSQTITDFGQSYNEHEL